jgi:hypothetical protein
MNRVNNNENGEPVMVNGNFQIEDTEKFTEEFMELANTETEIGFTEW